MARIAGSIDILQQSLAASSLRHQVLANNLANANTPGFQAAGVQFESLLSEALAQAETGLVGRRTDPRHLPIGAAHHPAQVKPVVGSVGGVSRADGNNVDPEREAALLAANQIWYGGLVRAVSDHFQRYRIAITEGRR